MLLDTNFPTVNCYWRQVGLPIFVAMTHELYTVTIFSYVHLQFSMVLSLLCIKSLTECAH